MRASSSEQGQTEYSRLTQIIHQLRWNTPPHSSFDIIFGSEGNSAEHLCGGWSAPEEGITWSVETESHVLLPPAEPGEYLLEIYAFPFLRAPLLPLQRLAVCANDVQIGISHCARPARVAYRIPREVIRPGEPIRIRFLHPDASRPCDLLNSVDERILAFAFSRLRFLPTPQFLAYQKKTLPPIALAPMNDLFSSPRNTDAKNDSVAAVGELERLTGLKPQDLMLQFESLGQSCEFGLVQRRCGAEPLGLFRFSSIFLDSLLRGLDSKFEAIENEDAVHVDVVGQADRAEFRLTQSQYEMESHTFIQAEQTTAEEVRIQGIRKLKFLKRKLLDDLEVSRKIFVRTMLPDISAQHQANSLLLALNRYAAHTLLCVVPADETHPAGSVERISSGLFMGFIDRFAPANDSHLYSLNVWLSICANAFILHASTKANLVDCLPVTPNV
jgi:hypothetical protein